MTSYAIAKINLEVKFYYLKLNFTTCSYNTSVPEFHNLLGICRFGGFYFPMGTKVFNERPGYGFYRNRGQKVIHLNRMEGVTSPAGKYRCEIPDADGEMKSIFIN